MMDDQNNRVCLIIFQINSNNSPYTHLSFLFETLNSILIIIEISKELSISIKRILTLAGYMNSFCSSTTIQKSESIQTVLYKQAQSFIIKEILLMESSGQLNWQAVAVKGRTKREIYRILVMKGGLYLPSESQASSDYIHDIMVGKKKAS